MCNFGEEVQRYEGDACEIPRVLACEDLIGSSTRAECLGRTVTDFRGKVVRECIWCERDDTCHNGNLEGPVLGVCREWFYKVKREIGLIVLAIIFIVTLGIGFLINMISAVITDVRTGKNSGGKLTADEVRRNWWRDERSNKAWMLFDQFQFMSYYIIVSVLFPTRLISFTSFFNWSNLALPLGFVDNSEKQFPYRAASFVPTEAPTVSTPTFAPTLFVNLPTVAAVPTAVVPTAKKLLSFGQYANSFDATSEQVFPTTMFWFAILLGGFTIIYIIFAVIIGLICSSLKMHLQRTVHVIIRILLLGYTPILFTAAYHTKSRSETGRSIAGSIIALIFIGIGLPLFAFLIVARVKEPEKLFDENYKLKFGAFYAAFHYKKAKFCIVIFIKKFLVAIFLGFLAWDFHKFVFDSKNYVIPQIIVPVVILIGYIVFLIIVKPFLDQVHLYVEIALSAINFISLLIAFTHIKKPSPGGEIAFCILQIVGYMICIGAFINSWLMMEQKSLKECILCQEGSKK
eukprot:TRINITY_DN3368_c0_g2_i1.p1 TRINITY_DN3368_c0_g2~~TRINITY_DN3368_c0_g2_i1.p1  ORF type:complete len:516 (+),score=73.24 TRINITY_DN3368_c0_g2_i1:168-1715(+)